MARARPDYPTACLSDKIKDMPNLIRVKSCDQKRGKISG